MMQVAPPGAWLQVRAQRHARHEGKLGDLQFKLLNVMDFDWESGAAEWMDNYLKVKSACEGKEVCSVSRKYVTVDGSMQEE